MLIGELVRIRCGRRYYRYVLSISAMCRLDAGDVDSGGPATTWQIFNVEGRRLALSTDISDGRGTLLVHHIDGSTLARLKCLLL